MFEARQILTGSAGFGTAAVASILPEALWGPRSIKPDEASALLVIDVQNCFLPGGSLAVKDGDAGRSRHQPHRQGALPTW